MRKQFHWTLGLIAVLALFVSAPVLAQVDDEHDRDHMFQEGQQLVQEEEYEEAAEIFAKLVEQDDEFGPGWFFLGYSLHMNGDLEKAMKAHKRAAGFSQFEGIATYNIGCAHALMGHREEALEAIQQSVELGFNQVDQIESDSDLYALHTDFRFARILADIGDNEDVVSHLESAEEHLRDGEFAKAAELYKQILENDTRNAFATYRLGYALHGAGELDSALKMHTKATRFPGVAPVATYNIACVHSLQDNKDEAFKYLKKATRLGFTRLDAFNNDPDLDNIRNDERFTELVSMIEEGQAAKKESMKDKKSSEGSRDKKDSR